MPQDVQFEKYIKGEISFLKLLILMTIRKRTLLITTNINILFSLIVKVI